MGEEKSSPSSVARGSLDRDLERLIPVAEDPADDSASASAAAAAHHHSGREAFHRVVHSWASKKFMTGCNLAGSEKEPLYGSGSLIHSFGGAYIIVLIEVEENSYSLYWLQEHQNVCFILLPIAITFYITWWFIHFVDGFFSPIYAGLGIDIFGLGFITSITFIFLIGVFMSSWLGASVLSLGEWFIKRMPFIRYIYNASKQISTAISPDQNTQAFKEVVIIRHPRIGEYAFGFITSSVVLQNYSGEEHLICVYVPTNHLYIGDIFMINVRDVFRPNLSVREGMEIVVSGGMSMPQMLSTLESH